MLAFLPSFRILLSGMYLAPTPSEMPWKDKLPFIHFAFELACFFIHFFLLFGRRFFFAWDVFVDSFVFRRLFSCLVEEEEGDSSQ
jgi:hypothetical protein